MIVVVMGVSGSGKTTLGEALAAALGASYLEADAYHPAENVARMAAGQPLDDVMRRPWLVALARAAAEAAATGPVVFTCSALKRAYRDLLRAEAGRITFLFLDGPLEVLEARVSGRKHDYMPASLLASQLATLEPPEAGEPDCHRLDFTRPVAELVAKAKALLAER
jgi:gluconokinase